MGAAALPSVTESMPPMSPRLSGARVPVQRRRQPDRFFQHLFSSMRNGVLAITRDGTIAEMNAEAFRIFQLKRGSAAVGLPFTEVLAKHPDIVRVLRNAFELSHLPSRAELRLKSSDKVIGYTLSHVHDERGQAGHDRAVESAEGVSQVADG